MRRPPYASPVLNNRSNRRNPKPGGVLGRRGRWGWGGYVVTGALTNQGVTHLAVGVCLLMDYLVPPG